MNEMHQSRSIRSTGFFIRIDSLAFSGLDMTHFESCLILKIKTSIAPRQMHLKDRRVESTYRYSLQHSTFRLRDCAH